MAGPKVGDTSDSIPVLFERVEKANRPIPDQYIVVFTNDIDDAPARARDPSVSYVEQDQVVSIDVTQSGATWGLDRIDQASLPLNTSYTYEATGAGVNAYMIDTGILSTHAEFGGRVNLSFNAILDSYGPTGCHWHGTHVGGTVGGAIVGVAKNVKLYAVRVLDCLGIGTNRGVIAGIDWVTANRVLPAVANMSLGGGFAQSLNDAVQRSIDGGVSYVIAAGNSTANACSYSPASTPAAVTVGPMTSIDAQASFSNFGTCVDIYAPGEGIYSAMNSSTTSMGTASGTSMATPHVAGAAALYLESNPSASPATVAQALSSSATQNVLTALGAGSPNLLLENEHGCVATSTTTTTAAATGRQRTDCGLHLELCRIDLQP